MDAKDYINEIEKLVENELLINGMMNVEYMVVPLHGSFHITLEVFGKGYLTPIYTMVAAQPTLYYLSDQLSETIKEELKKAIKFLRE